MASRVEKQVHLPLRKAVEIAVKSLRVRAGRSVLTLITIGMAIAFLAYIWMTRAGGAAIAARVGSSAAQTAASGATARTVWLLALSMLVCLVGISNAMLMSVLERFREIGTMKGLGALDSFILKLFFLESLFLGATGAVAGVVLGGVLALLALWRDYGSAAWEHMPWGMLAAISAAAVVVGLVVTAAAAAYPAYRAARMEPIAAMRVEV
jgi:putative ABC transport system permease protein